MFQKVSILASIRKDYLDYKQISLEIVLQRNETKTILNSGFMQNNDGREALFDSVQMESLQRKSMLSSTWWKGKNESHACLFEFLNKEYEALDIVVHVTNDTKTHKECFLQPIVEGNYANKVVEYSIKLSDL
jgi:hypothetical protein